MSVSLVLRERMRFNKFLKLKSSSGQVAIILILVVAISLIFYAAALNLGKISKIKTLTTIASNQSASQMASQMASYGQQLFEVQLGGATKVCGWTGVFAAILTVIIVVIAIYTQQYELLTAIVVTTVAVLNLILQLTVVQPGISEMWNDIKNKTLSTREIFIENGVQTGLSGAITDNKQVPDFEDLDRDGLFGLDSAGKPLDTISRYAVYYTKRLKESTSSPQVTAITAFQNALNEFLFAGADGWGLFDPPNPNASCASSECNPCCVPEYKTDINGAFVLDSTGAQIPLRPKGCPTDLLGARGICINSSDYPDPNGYPWVYDPSLENRSNAFLSFRELIGRDDRHKDYHKNPAAPNGKQLAASFPALPAVPTLLQRFVVKDTEGYYSPKDTRQSIEPFFYKVSDWKVDLKGLPATPFTTLPNLYDPKRYECHWCTVNRVPGIADECPAPAEQPAEIPQLVLPNPPGLFYNTTQCVDGTDKNVLGNPPLAVDRVTLPTGILAANNECAQDAFDIPSLGLGFWKRGADDFCSTVYPYSSNCDKHKSASGWCTGADGSLENCECSTSGKSDLWPDDVFDDTHYGIYDFVQDSFDVRSRNINELAGDFVVWYPTIAEWIEPPNTPLPHPSTGYSGGNICYVCDSKKGYLWQGRDDIGIIMNRLADFGGFGSNNYSGSHCDATVGGDSGAVWCVPPVVPGNPENSYGLDECRSVTVSEAATFDTNSNGIRGDLEDVVACLTWNIDDTVTYADATTARGNYEKFNKCATDCSIEHCSDLPRSLVPGVNTAIPNLVGLGTLQSCLNSCNNAVCTTMNPALFAGNPTLVPNDDPALINFQTDFCPTWGPGNVWYDAIASILSTSLCNPAPGGWLDNIVQSVPEAQVQAAKFRKRRDFLQGRLKELYGMIVPNNSDFTQLESCSSNCNNANCQAMDPVYFVSSGPLQTCLNFCSNAICNAMPNRPEFTAAGLPDPATVNFDATECGATWVSGNLWYDTIQTILANDGEADPSLVDFNTTQCGGAWGPGNAYYDRIQKTGIFTRAYKKFDNFLTCNDANGDLIPDGPACRLIKARIENNGVASGLPYQAIYGWQTDAPPGRTKGYWHIVRVDARAPGNCDGACVDGTIASGDPGWPRVRTYTKSWGLERCYEMADTDGMVKARVTRYDEARDASRITFPNGVSIWDFRTQHPKRDSKDSFLTTLGMDCVGSMIPDPPVPPNAPCDPSVAANTCTYKYFKGAFILNEFIDIGDAQGRRDNISCWRHVNSLLTKGITSETCARYYFHGGGNPGMGIEFVPCPAIGF